MISPPTLFGVSRAPVREALRALAMEGLVEVASGSTAVTTRMSVVELQELYEIRETLEPLTTRLAVSNVGRDEGAGRRAGRESANVGDDSAAAQAHRPLPVSSSRGDQEPPGT